MPPQQHVQASTTKVVATCSRGHLRGCACAALCWIALCRDSKREECQKVAMWSLTARCTAVGGLIGCKVPGFGCACVRVSSVLYVSSLY